MMIETGSRPATEGFVGGRLCLDFANTMHGRLSDEPRDDLASYDGLLSWGLGAKAISLREAQRLRREARRRPKDAASALERARILRDALYRIFSAAAAKRTPKESDLATLNNELAKALNRLQLFSEGDGLRLDWAGDEDGLDRILWPVAHSAATLLTSDQLSLVRECDLEQCTWLFVDTSKNHRRRWCDMKGCGNRAKFRRYYQRNRVVTPRNA